MNRFLKIIFVLITTLLIFDNTAIMAQKNECMALNYHRIRHDNWFDRFLGIFSNSKELKIYSVTDQEFEQHMKWLVDHDAHFVTLNEFTHYKDEKKFPQRCVLINFDDMDRSIYRYAQPVLEKYKIPAAGFIITGEVGNHDFNNIALANLDELKEMNKSGLWTFSTHTHDLHESRKNVSVITLEENKKKITKDLVKSMNYIDKHFNTKVDTFAYPYGQTNEEVIEEAHKAGVKYGFTLVEKAIQPDDNNDYLPRVLVSNTSFESVIKTWEGLK